MNRQPTLSQKGFVDGDYDDGEVRALIVGSKLWEALHSEIWLNCSPTTQEHFRQLMLKPTYFMGTVVSTKRQQVELTVVPLVSQTKGPGNLEEISISLDNVARFL